MEPATFQLSTLLTFTKDTLVCSRCSRIDFHCDSWQERLRSKRSWFPGNGSDMLENLRGSMSWLPCKPEWRQVESSISVQVMEQKGWTILAQLNQHSDNMYRALHCGWGYTGWRNAEIKGHYIQGVARAQSWGLWHWAVRGAFWKDWHRKRGGRYIH